MRRARECHTGRIAPLSGKLVIMRLGVPGSRASGGGPKMPFSQATHVTHAPCPWPMPSPLAPCQIKSAGTSGRTQKPRDSGSGQGASTGVHRIDYPVPSPPLPPNSTPRAPPSRDSVMLSLNQAWTGDFPTPSYFPVHTYVHAQAPPGTQPRPEYYPVTLHNYILLAGPTSLMYKNKSRPAGDGRRRHPPSAISHQPSPSLTSMRFPRIKPNG